MTNTNPRRSLIVSTPATRRAYDAGVKAAESGKLDEAAAIERWETRNWAAEWFDGDASDAFAAGFSDTPAADPITELVSEGVTIFVWSGHAHATRADAEGHRDRIAARDVELAALEAQARSLGIDPYADDNA